MPRTAASTIVSICAAPTVEGLRELTVPVLERHVGSLAADPILATEACPPESLPALVIGWVGRFVSRAGFVATVIAPDSGVVLEYGEPSPKMAVTALALDPDPALVDQLYALGIWSRFVSRRRRWQMRLSPNLMAEIAANAACASPVLTIQVARWRNERLAIVAGDVIAAEVTGRALRSVLQPAGDVGQTPWQTSLVQAAGERGLGVRHGEEMTIEARWAGPGEHPDWLALRARLVRVAHLIDCRLDGYVNEHGT